MTFRFLLFFSPRFFFFFFFFFKSLLQAHAVVAEECEWSELVDPCIMDQKGGVSGIIGHGFKARVCEASSLVRTAQLAKACLAFDPLARPSMEEVAPEASSHLLR